MTRGVLLAALLLCACDQPGGAPVQRIEFGKSGQGQALAAASATPTATVSSACEAVTFEDVPLTHCIADPAKHRITTVLGNPPLRSMKALAASRPAGAPKVAFAMNAGMFDEDGKPIGYYVRAGERGHELNRADGPGNFHMKPNGVFFGSGGKWQVRTADDFYANVGERPEFGTQSGPMLVIAGKLHPQVTDDGPSRTIRNAVGVDTAGRAHFVISDAPISFGKLARYFRDVLKTPNALYLDGSVSELWDPAADRMDARAPIGPILVVEEKKSRP
ncbi:MAG: phosphodiester glycosidase family protein [Tsuneonella sp.]